MSANETAGAGPVAPTVHARWLQIVLLSMTVPFREGGGLVFPIGFPGPGFRLEEGPFERYRAALDQRLLNEASKQAARRLRLSFFILLMLVLAISVAFNYFLEGSSLDPVWRPWLQMLLLVPFAPIAAYTFLFNYRSLRDFNRRFPDARRVAMTACLGRRMLGYIVAHSFRPGHELVRVLIFAALGGWLLRIAWREDFATLYLIAAWLVSAALFKAWRLLVYWRFRRAHGRAPALADVEPLTVPYGLPHA